MRHEGDKKLGSLFCVSLSFRHVSRAWQTFRSAVLVEDRSNYVGMAPSCSLSSCIFPPPLLVMSLCLEGTAVLAGLGVSATPFCGRLQPAAHVALRCNCAAASGKSWRSAAAGCPWGCWCWLPCSHPGGHCCCCWCSSWLESAHAAPPVG